MSGKDNGQVLLMPIFFEFLANKVLNNCTHLLQKLGSRSDAVAVKDSRPSGQRFLLQVFGGSKAPRSLLIELGTRCHSIDCHVNADLWFNNTNDPIQVMHNSQHHILLAQNLGHVQVRRMRASVNDAIEVEIEVIYFRKQRLIRDDLIDLGVSLRDPSVKLKKKSGTNKE